MFTVSKILKKEQAKADKENIFVIRWGHNISEMIYKLSAIKRSGFNKNQLFEILAEKFKYVMGMGEEKWSE